MSRDGNGNYTLPAGNPVVADTLIESAWANDTMNDLASEMTDSLSRSGKGGLTAPLGIEDSAGSVPGLNFNAEPTSGFQRDAVNTLSIRVTTTEVAQFIKTGVKFLDNGELKTPLYEETGESVMKGEPNATRCWFYNSTPPPGWTYYQPDLSVRVLTIQDQVDGGTIGGVDNPESFVANIVGSTSTLIQINKDTEGTAITEAQMPAHTHSYGDYNSNGNQGSGGAGVAGTATTGTTGSAGSGQAHVHNFQYTALADGAIDEQSQEMSLGYAKGLLATLD